MRETNRKKITIGGKLTLFVMFPHTATCAKTKTVNCEGGITSTERKQSEKWE